MALGTSTVGAASGARRQLGPLGARDAVLLLGAVLAFLLLPDPAAPVVALLLLAALAFVSPLGALLAVLGALPLHFLVRRVAGPVELSLPDAALLAAALGLLAGVYWRAILGGSRSLLAPLRAARRSPYFWPALLLVVMSLATFALLPPRNARAVVVGLRALSFVLEPIAVYALVLLAIRDRRTLWLMLDVLFAGAVAASLVALGEAAWVALNPSPDVGGYYRVQGPFNHPNTLALYLSRMLPLFGALGLLLRRGGPRARVYLAGAVAMGLAMLLTGSRGGWLAVAVAALPVALLGRSYRWLAPAAGASLAGIILLVATGQDRLTALVRVGRGSADTRERLWRGALDTIGESPVWGSGLANLGWMRRYIPRQRLVGTELIDAHNLFLDFWAKLGVLGLAAVLWLIGRFFLLTLRVWRTADRELRAVAVGMLAGMTGALAHGMVDAFYFGLPWAVLFWLLLALAEALGRIGDGSEAAGR